MSAPGQSLLNWADMKDELDKVAAGAPAGQPSTTAPNLSAPAATSTPPQPSPGPGAPSRTSKRRRELEASEEEKASGKKGKKKGRWDHRALKRSEEAPRKSQEHKAETTAWPATVGGGTSPTAPTASTAPTLTPAQAPGRVKRQRGTDEEEEEKAAGRTQGGKRGRWERLKKSKEVEGGEEKVEEKEQPRPARARTDNEVTAARKVQSWLKRVDPTRRPKTVQALRNSTTALLKVQFVFPTSEVIPLLTQLGVLAVFRDSRGKTKIRVLPQQLPLGVAESLPSSGNLRIDILHKATAWAHRNNAANGNKAVGYASFELRLSEFCSVPMQANFEQVLGLLQEWRVLALEADGKVAYLDPSTPPAPAKPRAQ